MCGLIGGALDGPLPLDAVAHRGPDDQGQVRVGPWLLGHTRLAIQGVTGGLRQPCTVGDVAVTYNGELWHPDRVRARFARPWATSGDTEPVAAVLASDGAAGLAHLDGMFALAWADAAERLHLARDPWGEVPIHYGHTPAGGFVYASEVAALLRLGAVPPSVRYVPPGHAVTVTPDGALTTSRWFKAPPAAPATEVAALLGEAVLGRLTADVPVALLVSGGIDSSLIALLASGYAPGLPAYTAVHHPRSPDLRHARIVAEALGLELQEVPIPAPTAADLAEVVRVIEQPHKAQVEIAWACLHLARRAQADGIRVVLSGEGADELVASYGMAFHGIRRWGWRGYRERTFADQHRKNFPRTNKVFMRHGVEARLPFLHPPLVAALLGASQAEVTENGRHPKALLASIAGDRLPAATVWRPKAAFQTAARLDVAAAQVVADPRAFYAAEYRRRFPGVTA